MKISQQCFLTAWHNQRLVKGALKCAHVRLDYPNYEDFFQEGILLYAQMLSQAQQLSRKEIDHLAFRKIIWHTLDLLRKDQRSSERQTSIEYAYAISQANNWNNRLAIEKEVTQMLPLEQFLFFQHLLAGKPISRLAKQIGISRMQLQRVKRRLLLRLRHVLEV